MTTYKLFDKNRELKMMEICDTSSITKPLLQSGNTREKPRAPQGKNAKSGTRKRFRRGGLDSASDDGNG